MSPEIQKVENAVEQMTASGGLVMLEQLKIRAALVVHDDDLAVQHGVKPEFSKCFHNGMDISC